MQESFSIVIPTYNVGPSFSTLLSKLTEQSELVKEIIVIDSSPGGNVSEICDRQGAKFILVDKKSFDHGGTRNLGASKATGDILMFITQDIVPFDGNLLQSFSTVFGDPSIGGAYARQIHRIGANPVESLSRKYSYPETSRINTYKDFEEKGVSALYFANPCACVRRDLFEKLGGFPDKIICNEDMVMAYKILKAGNKTAYVSDAVVYHSHDYSASKLINRYFDIGVFFKNYPDLCLKAKNKDEGFKQTKLSLLTLIAEKNIIWIPKFIIDTIAKLIGYNLGKHYKLLPNSLRILFSMNKNYWKKRKI